MIQKTELSALGQRSEYKCKLVLKFVFLFLSLVWLWIISAGFFFRLNNCFLVANGFSEVFFPLTGIKRTNFVSQLHRNTTGKNVVDFQPVRICPFCFSDDCLFSLFFNPSAREGLPSGSDLIHLFFLPPTSRERETGV